MKVVCDAIIEDGRIQFDIRKGDRGYDEVAQALQAIEEEGPFSWYGDITTASGHETTGLIITNTGQDAPHPTE